MCGAGGSRGVRTNDEVVISIAKRCKGVEGVAWAQPFNIKLGICAAKRRFLGTKNRRLDVQIWGANYVVFLRPTRLNNHYRGLERVERHLWRLRWRRVQPVAVE